MKYAIFPLNLFILPGEKTYLHIFEPRYRQMLKDVEKTNMPFGLYYENDDNEAKYGTMVSLVEVVKRYPEGKMDIQIQGEYIFRLDTFYDTYEDKLYSAADISRLDAKGNEELDYQSFKEISKLIRLRDEDKLVEIPRFIWDAAVDLNLTSQDKYEIARMGTVENQQALLRSHIQLRKAILDQELQQNFDINQN